MKTTSEQMKSILSGIIFLLLTIPAISQNKVSFDDEKEPYFLVDTFHTHMKYLILTPTNIESVNVFKDSSAIAAYGEKARYGAVIIKTKPNTILLRISDLLNKYNVIVADRNLRVYLNKIEIKRPELFLAEAGEIVEMEITFKKNWIHTEEANNTEKIIIFKTADKEIKLRTTQNQ